MAFTLEACLKHNESPEEKSGAGEKPPGAACFFRYYVGKLWTVSYTHLDVYKRQSTTLFNFFIMIKPPKIFRIFLLLIIIQYYEYLCNTFFRFFFIL